MQTRDRALRAEPFPNCGILQTAIVLRLWATCSPPPPPPPPKKNGHPSGQVERLGFPQAMALKRFKELWSSGNEEPQS